MHAVTNTSPPSNLSMIDRLHLLRERYCYGRERYGTIAIPPMV